MSVLTAKEGRGACDANAGPYDAACGFRINLLKPLLHPMSSLRPLPCPPPTTEPALRDSFEARALRASDPGGCPDEADAAACAPEPFELAPAPALAAMLAELTSEVERYLLVWQASGRTDSDAQTASQRMQLARDVVAELALWNGFRLELHVETLQGWDERLACFAVGRRVMPGGARLRGLESFCLNGARIWVLRTEHGYERLQPVRRVANVHALRCAPALACAGAKS